MNVLITGGLGFIGSSLAEELLKKKHRVYVVDNKSTNVVSTISDSSGNYFYEQLDLARMNEDEIAVLDRLIGQVDIIYHLAGSVGVKYIDERPQAAIQNNYDMNFFLLPLFEKHQKKVVFGSTSEVYGETSNATESDRLSLLPPPQLRWGYACSKLMTEFLFFSYSFPFTICRFFNISGNRQSGANGMVLPTFVECAAKGLPIQIHNDGKQIRCFCDIRDAVSFLSQLGEKDILNREIVNVGNELNICEIGDLAKKVKAKAKSSSEIVHIPFSEVFSKQTGEITLRIPNTDKMKQFYKCQHNLDSIVQSFFE